MSARNADVLTQKKLPDWVLKVIGWALLTLMTLGTTTAVTKSKLESLDAKLKEHEVVQRQVEVTKPEFDEFKEGLYRRMDQDTRRMERIEGLLIQHDRNSHR